MKGQGKVILGRGHNMWKPEARETSAGTVMAGTQMFRGLRGDETQELAKSLDSKGSIRGP